MNVTLFGNRVSAQVKRRARCIDVGSIPMTSVLRSRGRCGYKPRNAQDRRLSLGAGREPGADPPLAPARCGQGWLLLRPLSLACRWPSSPMSPRGCPSVLVCALKSSSSKDTNPAALGAPHGTSFYLNPPLKTLSPKTHFATLRVLECIINLGVAVQPTGCSESSVCGTCCRSHRSRVHGNSGFPSAFPQRPGHRCLVLSTVGSQTPSDPH